MHNLRISRVDKRIPSVSERLRADLEGDGGAQVFAVARQCRDEVSRYVVVYTPRVAFQL